MGGPDIVEIALDSITDSSAFEALASEIMRNEGYPNIRPLGGVGDLGQDATADPLFVSEGRLRVVFQYTLQEHLAAKIEDTITRLDAAGIQYSQLVLVTPRLVGAKRQEELIRDIRVNYGVELKICDRRTIHNRLADFSNGIYHRFFPDIERQIANLRGLKPNISYDSHPLQMAMLKTSIAFTFGARANRARKSIFDKLVLAIVYNHIENGITLNDLHNEFLSVLGIPRPEESQLKASLDRLAAEGLVENVGGAYQATKIAEELVACSTVQSNQATDTLIADIVGTISRDTEQKFSDNLVRLMDRNIRDVLVQLFRLLGIEIANQMLSGLQPGAVYLENSDTLIQAARRDLPANLGDLIVAAVADMLNGPTLDQAATLSNWSLAYLGIAIMNLDPQLRELQATHIAQKTFILDTDFILDCLVQESPLSEVYLKLVQTLVRFGCSVIIPETCLEECVLHAKISPRTYRHFRTTLGSLSPGYVDERVWNAFVKGYYYGIRGGKIPRDKSFYDYLRNYYEPTAPTLYLRRVIEHVFPEGVKILDPGTLLHKEIPANLLNVLSDELFLLIQKSRKGDYQTPEEAQILAHHDARLFLPAPGARGGPNLGRREGVARLRRGVKR